MVMFMLNLIVKYSMKILEDVITVPIGKVIRRLPDGALLGRKYTLGYLWYRNGVKLDTPVKERYADFEEVDDPDKDLLTHRIGEVGVDSTELIIGNLINEICILNDKLNNG